MKKLSLLWFGIFYLIPLNSQTKPLQGLIKGENDSTLTSVKIISIPSNTKINADKEGEFSFSMPVRDRKLIINHSDHYPDTLDAILFENHTKHNLTNVVAEIDTTDPSYILSLIKDTLNTSKGNTNFKYFSFSKSNNHNYSDINSLLYNMSSYSLSGSVYGYSHLYYRGNSMKNIDFLLDGIKINNLVNSLLNLNQFSIDEMLGIEVIPLGFFHTMPTLGTFNLVPKLDYSNDASYRYQITENSFKNYDTYGSLGFKYATVNGTYKKNNKKQF